jgi:hypothetical protein
MQKLINHISKLIPSENDGVIEIIAINKELSFWASQPMYSQKTRLVKHYYDDCYVVSINGVIKATLRSKENPYTNCVIYESDSMLNKAENLINWGEVSRILAENRSSITKTRIPEKHKETIETLINSVADWLLTVRSLNGA